MPMLYCSLLLALARRAQSQCWSESATAHICFVHPPARPAQIAAKADLNRLEQLEAQLDGALDEVSALRSKQVWQCNRAGRATNVD
jgi:type II secretory pathway component PulM